MLQLGKYFQASLDKVIFVPTLLQIFSGLAPLIFLKILFSDYSDSTIIRVEQLFAITIFCSVLIAWSSNLFLARIYSRLLNSGAYTTIILTKAILALLCLLILEFFSSVLNVLPNDSSFFLASCVILLTHVLDISWVYIGKKKLFIPQLQLIVQYGLAIILISNDFEPLTAIPISWFLAILIFYIPILGEIRFNKFSISLSYRILRRFFFPTSSEVATSLFSKLDVVYVASILSPKTAVIYILLRKHVIALQSVLFASLRLLYIEQNEAKLDTYNLGFRAYIFIGLICGSALILFSVVYFFQVQLDFNGLMALGVFLSGIPLGYLKNKTQFQEVYRKSLFKLDLTLTLSSFIFYVFCLVAMSIFSLESLVLMVLIRIASDLIYLSLFKIYKIIKIKR